jgi:hypothetical protein
MKRKNCYPVCEHGDIMLYCVHPLPGDGRETSLIGNRFLINGVKQPVSDQQLCKHVPAATDTNATIEKRCFLCGP